MSYKILHKDKKTKARVGLLETKSGKIETPFFMPVATKTTVKFLSPEDLETMNAKAIISNAFVLSLKPGCELIKKEGGIGKFMTYSGIVFTDSGGFQMYSESLYLGDNDNGVIFKDPFAGNKIFITPEKDMEIQLDLNSDVAMCLDSMPLYDKSKEQIKEAVRKTVIWAKRCKEHHDKMQRKIPKGKRQLLFCISQGGIYKDLREKCAKELLKYDFDGYAIGGIALPEFAYKGEMGKAKKLEQNSIKIHKKMIPENKPVYVMGEGSPIWILEAVALGCDVFDSRFPTQNARRGNLFTSKGKIRLTNAKYEKDHKPIDENCDCFVCKRYSRAYIRYLLKQEEGSGKRLASYHNLYFLQKMMKDTRESIRKGKFDSYLKKMRKLYPKGKN